MLLVVAATEMELLPVRERLAHAAEVECLVCGVGPVEAATRLTAHLARRPGNYRLVILCGVAGAYPEAGPQLLDLCLAEREVLGDLGLVAGEEISPLAPELGVQREFSLDAGWRAKAATLLANRQSPCRVGTFVTVNSASATASRGRALRDRFQAICENMEGAAVARACQEFAVPCLEVRAVSNYVEDRDLARWRLREACQQAAEAAALFAATFAVD